MYEFLLILAQITPSCRDIIDLGDVYYREFKNKDAYYYYNKADSICPGYETLMKTTRALNDIGEDAGGEKGSNYFKRAIRGSDSLRIKYPDSLQSWFLHAIAAGNLALNSGGKTKVKLSRAVKSSADKALEIDPEYAPAHVVLGIYYRQVATANKFLKLIAKAFLGGLPEGTLEDSRQELQRVIELDPDNIFGYFELAQTYHAMKKDREAKQLLEKVLTLPDSDHQAGEMKRKSRKFLKSW